MPRLSRAKTAMGKASGEETAPLDSGFFVHSMPGHIVRRLQQVAVRLFTEEVGPELTPVQFASLFAIGDKPDIGQAALAALIGYDRATIGGVIDRLEQKGLVVRVPSPEDRRSNALALTATGREIVTANKSKVETVQKRLLQPLDAEEQRHFEAMCLKILAHHRG